MGEIEIRIVSIKIAIENSREELRMIDKELAKLIEEYKRSKDEEKENFFED